MVQKPKIQYVGQFYVHGSASKKLEQPPKPKTSLPLAKLQKIEKIYVDPVALVGILVAVVMLVTMVVGALQIKEDWIAYERMSSYVSSLNKENSKLRQAYHDGYDLEDIKVKAAALGLVPKSEVERISVTVTLPEPEPEVSRIDEIKGFLEGLFA